jgi:hypothetical protein
MQMGSKNMSAAEKLDELRLGESLGAAVKMTEAFRLQDIADSLIPSSVRMMLDIQRGIENLVNPLGRFSLDFGTAALARNIRNALHESVGVSVCANQAPDKAMLRSVCG